MCEKQTNCGFYKYLIENNIVDSGQDCPKLEPEECPRYEYGESLDEDHANTFFRVDNVLTTSKLLSREEIDIVYPEGFTTKFFIGRIEG